jgi:5-methylcytosine-specific restriction enzyme subunit McrC
MAIPIANIYYLLCYAWDEFAPRQMTEVNADLFPDSLHLFSHLLVAGVRTLHRRGLERGYVSTEEPTTTLRGRILIGKTIQIRVQQPQKAFCEFDDLSADILTNQILKATMTAILGTQDLRAKLRADVRQATRILSAVSNVELTTRSFHQVHLHQNNRLYSFLINICRFLFESLHAEERPGQYRFRDVDRDEKRMRRVFEKFVRNFFARRQSAFDVQKDRMKWEATSIDDSDLDLIPQMETDVTLRSADRTIVIECKYTDSLYQRRYFADKLRSAHLYQLSSYLRNLEKRSGPDCTAEGILLYPTAGTVFDQSYRLHNHRIRIKTVNLNQPWLEIENEMLTLLA